LNQVYQAPSASETIMTEVAYPNVLLHQQPVNQTIKIMRTKIIPQYPQVI